MLDGIRVLATALKDLNKLETLKYALCSPRFERAFARVSDAFGCGAPYADTPACTTTRSATLAHAHLRMGSRTAPGPS